MVVLGSLLVGVEVGHILAMGRVVERAGGGRGQRLSWAERWELPVPINKNGSAEGRGSDPPLRRRILITNFPFSLSRISTEISPDFPAGGIPPAQTNTRPLHPCLSSQNGSWHAVTPSPLAPAPVCLLARTH